MALRLVLAAAAVASVASVDRSKFRKCSDAGFCRRHRDKTAEPELRVLPETVSLDSKSSLLTATVHSAAPGAPPLDLRVFFYESGIARVRLHERDDKPARWESPDVIVESGTKPASKVAVVDASAASSALAPPVSVPTADATYVSYQTSTGAPVLLVLTHKPFSVSVYMSGSTTPVISVNGRGLSYYEHRRVKGDGSQVAADTASAAAAGAAAHAGRKILDWGEDGKPIYEDGTHGELPELHDSAKGAGSAADDQGGRDILSAVSADTEPGMWEETFSTHHDSKPHGPTSVGVDITFPSATHVYGIPEHASTHALRATDGTEGSAEYGQPYRLYNLDVFEYELDNPMALYGSIPFMLAHSPSGSTVGVFWNNPTETYVDVKKGTTSAGSMFGAAKLGIATRWVSESGHWDLSLVPGPGPKHVITQYTGLTGTTQLPPLFSLGYHQCRWNYKDEADVYGVDAKFEEHNFPYDVLWLDIEHTDGKRYFTWDSRLFPNSAAMQDKLAARGHKMVTIIDPHIKRDHAWGFYSDASSKGLFIRNAQGTEYDGWCWPGSSSYLDFTSPNVRSWWADQFALDKYKGSTLSLYTWNDMNEPSVFNGPEVSMHKDAKSIAGVEHREWHNLYGFYQQMATFEGHVRRTPDANTRPFVLSRAFFAGSQRFGAIWTGDNAARWDHLAAASPMLLTIGVSGLTFAGADVGGFFNNPSVELMVRWYQAGSYQPFFRAHAHIDTARREPWLFGDETLAQLRDIVRNRYTLLPLWYTLFFEAHTSGVPAMRPLWLEYPQDSAVFGIDDQWLVGSDLLVKPVTSEGGSSVEMHFPGEQPWYDVDTFAKVHGPGKQTIAAPLSKIPVFQRGGAIVPRQMRPRRASSLMAHDPYTLVVTLDAAKRAAGQLYLDDGNTFDYAKKQAFRLRALEYAPVDGSRHVLKSSTKAGGKSFAPTNTVERIVVAGLGAAPKTVAAQDADGTTRQLTFTFDAASDVLVIRKPDVKIAYDWTVTLTM